LSSFHSTIEFLFVFQEDLINNLKKRLETLKENQRTINDESEDNKILGLKVR